MATISILLPVYDAAPYLPACLDSILQQDDPHWELLAVNNCSTDHSGRILAHYAQQDPRIRPLDHGENSIIRALRWALRESRGRWITRMDADDRMAPQKLRRLRAVLEERGRKWVATGAVEYFSEGTLGWGYQAYAQWLNTLTRAERNFEDRYRECIIPSPCWMCHREDLLACGAFDSERYPEDYDLAFRFFKAGYRVAGVPEVLHYWRDHPKRASRTQAQYSDNRFLDLKVDYFLELDHDAQRPLALWGAGRKGKKIAQLLVDREIPFYWLSNTASKIGHRIYGREVWHFQRIGELDRPQLILSVAAVEGRREIQHFLDQGGYRKNESYFWFC